MSRQWCTVCGKGPYAPSTMARPYFGYFCERHIDILLDEKVDFELVRDIIESGDSARAGGAKNGEGNAKRRMNDHGGGCSCVIATLSPGLTFSDGPCNGTEGLECVRIVCHNVCRDRMILFCTVTSVAPSVDQSSQDQSLSDPNNNGSDAAPLNEQFDSQPQAPHSNIAVPASNTDDDSAWLEAFSRPRMPSPESPGDKSTTPDPVYLGPPDAPPANPPNSNDIHERAGSPEEVDRHLESNSVCGSCTHTSRTVVWLDYCRMGMRTARHIHRPSK